jgi:tetratricopeptide (TPR) repeat protein
VDVREIGKDLGVRYVLEGSVRVNESEDSVRVTVQLIDAQSGKHLWAERYERAIKDVFSLHDEIVDKIEVAIDVKLIEGEQAISRRHSTQSYEAYKLYRRANDRFFELTAGGNDQAIKLLEQAVKIDPQFGAALALIGWSYHSRAAFGWSTEPRQDLERAWTYAQKALEVDPDQVEAHMLAGFLLVYRGQYGDARRMAGRAVEIDPANASAVGVQGLVFTWSGAPDLGLAKLKQAMEMAPFPPVFMYLEVGNAYLVLKQHEAAIPYLERAVQTAPSWLPATWLLVVAYAEAGRIEDARKQLDKMKDLDSSISLDHLNIQMELNADTEFVKRVVAALRKAGLK